MKQLTISIFVLSIIYQWNLLAQSAYPEKPMAVNDGIWYNKIFMSKDETHGWMCGDFGEIFLTENAGLSWKHITQKLTTSWLLDIYFQDNNMVGWIVGDFGICLHTTDGGYHWGKVNLEATDHLLNIKFFQDSNLGIITSEKGIIYITKDGGNVWSKTETYYSSIKINGAEFLDKNSALLYCDDATLIFSNDGLKDWKDIISNELTEKIETSNILCSRKCNTDIWFGCANGFLLKYNIVTRNLSANKLPTESSIKSIWFDSQAKNGYLITYDGTFFESSNSGNNWHLKNQILNNCSCASMWFNRSGDKGIIIGSNRNIMLTNNGGVNFNYDDKINIDLSELQIDFESDKRIICGEKGIIISANRDYKEWKRISNNYFKEDLHGLVFLKTAKLIFAVGESNSIVSVNENGQDWQVNYQEESEEYFNSITCSQDEKDLFVVGSNSQVMISSDQGKTWNKIKVSNSGIFSDIFKSRKSNRAWAVGQHSTILFTENNFKSSNRIPIKDTSDFLLTITFSSDEKIGFIASTSKIYDNHLFKSIDGGLSWSKIKTIPSNGGLQKVQFSNNDSLIAVTSIAGNIYLTNDQGLTWFKVFPKYTWQRLTDVCFDKNNQITIIGHGGTILQSSSTILPRLDSISIKDLKDIFVPEVFIKDSSKSQDSILFIMEASVLNGTFITGHDKKYERMELKLSDIDSIARWPKSIIPFNNKVNFKISMFNGWNIETKNKVIFYGESYWQKIKKLLMWNKTPESISEWSKTIGVNISALLLLYSILIIFLYFFFPFQFILWHESVANSRLPFPEKLSKFLALFLIGSPRSLDAFVHHYKYKVMQSLNSHEEVKSRSIWVKAPFKIDDKEVISFHAKENEKNYIPGLREIQQNIREDRVIIHMEGPGGLGKTSLALQLLRWATDNDKNRRLFTWECLPLYIDKLDEQDIDKVCKSKLELITDSKNISEALIQNLLRKKRIFALVDGISEMENVEQKNYDPERGGKDAHLIAFTSRKPINIPESTLIIPMGLKIDFLDMLLDSFTNSYAEAYKFGEQREILRDRVKSMVMELNGDDNSKPVPLSILKEIVKQASQLIDEQKSLSEYLPKNVGQLFNNYLGDLFRKHEDPDSIVEELRKAALVSVGLRGLLDSTFTLQDLLEVKPMWISKSIYAKLFSKETLDLFLSSGAMNITGEIGTRVMKFTHDPVGEYLAGVQLLLMYQSKTLTVEKMKYIQKCISSDSFEALLFSTANRIQISLTNQVPAG